MATDEKVVMDGVREYCESYPVRLMERDGRLCIEAENEGGYNSTEVDVLDVLAWVKKFRPDLLRDTD